MLLNNSPVAKPFNRVVDGRFFDASPAVSVRKGHLAAVPVIIGKQIFSMRMHMDQ